ncbi:MAG: hypothetical protein U0745_18740 [Polyangia bacterium]
MGDADRSMVNVTARKIREHGRDAREKPSTGFSRVYHGLLVSYPTVGRGMVIFRDPNGHRMVTTPVRRVLTDPDSDAVYVETDNSVYRLTFHAAVPLAAAC